jgi:predicted secreted protein
MSWLTEAVVYALIWWVVLFAVLPWGIQRNDNPAPGHDPGAPKAPRLWIKMAVTTGISAVIWLIAIWLIRSPWLSFRN